MTTTTVRRPPPGAWTRDLADARAAGAGTPMSARVLAALTTVVLALFYALFAVARHHHLLTTGYDLGIFEQEVASYAHLHWPTSTLKGPHFELLGDHFSPAMAVLAPFYRLFPGAQTLLLAQAILVALGAWPLVRWSAQALGRGSALIIGIGYGLSWGVAEAIGFDVHEVMLAVPLIAFAAVAYGEGRHGAAVAWMAPVVLVKEDLGLTLAALGLLVLLRGRRRLGAVTAVAGVAATLVETYLVIPAVAGTADSYTGQITEHSLLHIAVPETKLATIALLLATTAFLAIRSSVAVLLVPTLVWRMGSNNPAYWNTQYHYSLVLMPIVFAAAIDVLIRIDPIRRRRWLAAILVVAAAQLPNHLFNEIPQLLRPDTAAASIRQMLHDVPDDCSVSASNWLAPQLVTHHDVSLFGLQPLSLIRPDYIVVDTTGQRLFPISLSETRRDLRQARRSGYQDVEHRHGVVLLRRGHASCR